MEGGNTFYNILHVNPDASMNEIAHSYHKLAKTWHPDRNKSPYAEKIFCRIAEAYETLNDPNKRADYDINLAGNTQSKPVSEPNVSIKAAIEMFKIFEQMIKSQQSSFGVFGIPSIGNLIIRDNNPIHSVIPGVPMVDLMLRKMGGMPVRVAYHGESTDDTNDSIVSVSKLCVKDENGTHCKLRVIRRTPG